MKRQLNSIPNISHAGEIKLFEEMQKFLNQGGSRSVLCQKVHQHYVTFRGQNSHLMRREIADLLLVSLDYKTKRARISFLQAKRHKGKSLAAPIYKFNGEFGQFFLLKHKPILLSGGYPPHLLRFSPALSLTTYGVFYNDINNQIDFLYSAADHLKINSRSSVKGPLELDTSIVGNLPIRKNYFCGTLLFDELTAVDGIDAFEQNLKAWKIGAVLPAFEQDLILYHLFHIGLNLLKANGLSGRYENRSSFEELQGVLRSLAIDFGIDIDRDNEEWSEVGAIPFPSIMFVECDSEKEGVKRED